MTSLELTFERLLDEFRQSVRITLLKEEQMKTLKNGNKVDTPEDKQGRLYF